ncbi:MAG: hypothetical protein ABL994_06585, partial [Verrucomicrobiales bacterium]
MRVFVLGTGRCGTKTFIAACKHVTNFTCSHERHYHGVYGEARLTYPDNHIEADNRLGWMLGLLEERYGGEPVYIHLQRDPHEVVNSFLRRWDNLGGIIPVLANGILHPPVGQVDWHEDERAAVAAFYVRMMTANLHAFLKDKPHVLNISLDSAKSSFREFWDRIGATGDLEAALSEWDVRH